MKSSVWNQSVVDSTSSEAYMSMILQQYSLLYRNLISFYNTRVIANVFFFIINAGFIAILFYISRKPVDPIHLISVAAICIFCLILLYVWAKITQYYRRLIKQALGFIDEIELQLPIRLIKIFKTPPLTRVEKLAPFIFLALYLGFAYYFMV